MRFDSLEFLVFLIAVLGLEQIIRQGRGRKLLLLIASYLFYASWSPPFVLLLLFSTVLDFCVGRWLGSAKGKVRRRMLLGLSLVGNLGVLAFFKYGPLFAEVASLVPTMDLETAFPRRDDLIIPLGISFYTFQTISYSIDVYRRRVQPCRVFLDFAVFVTFFPQLIAGPVMRAGRFLPQIERNRRATREEILSGVELFMLGLVKKVVIADNLAILTDTCFGRPEAYTSWTLLLGSISFVVQVYCDFSGYSTMARGLAKMLGFDLPRNFNYPLLARNPVEFRKGWHITMSEWFRDYVYLPMVAGRRGQVRMVVAVVLTWLLFGLWHGGTWNFLLWGGFHGVWLAAYRLVRRPLRDRLSFRGSGIVGRIAMFGIIGFACILFRTADLGAAWIYIGRLSAWETDALGVSGGWTVLLLFLLGVHMASQRWYREDLMLRLRPMGQLALIGSASLLVSALAVSDKPFVYFQF